MCQRSCQKRAHVIAGSPLPVEQPDTATAPIAAHADGQLVQRRLLLLQQLLLPC